MNWPFYPKLDNVITSVALDQCPECIPLSVKSGRLVAAGNDFRKQERLSQPKEEAVTAPF